MTRMGASAEHGNGHPCGERVAAYVERKLTAEERTELEAHLAECAECRREVAEVALFLRRGGSRRRGWLAPSIAAAAAAALLVVLLWPDGVGEQRGGVLREPGAPEGLPPIAAVSPGPGTAVPPGSLVFTWRSVDSDAFYRLTAATAEGEVVWRVETGDTTAVPPAGTRWERGETYYWFVDALLPDGHEATTGVRRFRIAR